VQQKVFAGVQTERAHVNYKRREIKQERVHALLDFDCFCKGALY